jgi:DNA-binding transcriptional LysR family regulator
MSLRIEFLRHGYEYEAFIAVYETRNMYAAARQLDKERNALGKNIRALERRLGLGKLFFDDRPRGVKPSEVADEIYRKIKPLVVGFEHALDSIGIFNEHSEGTIRIATTTNFAGTYLNEKLWRFRIQYPNIKFDISILSVAQALESLEGGHSDMVLSAVPLVSERSHSYNQVELESFEQCFITTQSFARQNELSQNITQEKFNSLPFVAVGTYKHFVDNIRKPDILADTQDTISSLIKTNMFVAFGVWDVGEKLLGTEAFPFNVQGANIKRLSLVCAYPQKKSLTKLSDAFIKFLLDRSK